MRVLIVGQQDEDREEIVRRLRSAIELVEWVEAGDAETYGRALNDDEIDLVVTEAVLGWTTGYTVLQDIQTHMRDVPVIMVTGSENETLGAEGLRAGLAGCVPKDHLERLVPAVERAAEAAADAGATEAAATGATEATAAEAGRWQALAGELDISRRIQEMSTRVIQADEIDTLFQEILETTLEILHADSGSPSLQ